MHVNASQCASLVGSWICGRGDGRLMAASVLGRSCGSLVAIHRIDGVVATLRQRLVHEGVRVLHVRLGTVERLYRRDVRRVKVDVLSAKVLHEPLRVG